ncbi:MAG: HEPN domain-containing protein [Deltaproteobacteria bacterium]|nr:HEPN domain-containing protein [Deltaproteobacteria bacterium]
MQEIVKKYVDGARDDLAAAEALVNAGHLFHVPYLCHQAVFKLLRGFYLEMLNRYPLFEPHLPTLASAAGAAAQLTPDDLALLHELSFYPDVVGHSVYRQKILEHAKDANRILARATEIVDKLTAVL